MTRQFSVSGVFVCDREGRSAAGRTSLRAGDTGTEPTAARKADLVVLDMIMDPGIDGLETYRRILQINAKQKAVLVSGFSETDRVREAQKLGAGAYIHKPYVMEKIGSAIRDELRKEGR